MPQPPCIRAPRGSRSGGLDEDFFCYGEDVDLGFRLQLFGYKCVYVADAVAHHHGSAVTGDRSDFSTYHGQRNLVWVYVKNMPPLLFWPLLPYHLVLNLVALFACALRGQGRMVLKAKFDALRGLPRIWQKRRAIQGKPSGSCPQSMEPAGARLARPALLTRQKVSQDAG